MKKAKPTKEDEIINAAIQLADTALMNIHQIVAEFGPTGSVLAALAMVAISEMHEGSLEIAIDKGVGPGPNEIELFNRCRKRVRKAMEEQVEAAEAAEAATKIETTA